MDGRDVSIAMAKATKQPLIVTVSKGRPINEVVGDLKAAGFQVEGVLDAIGVVTGSAQSKSIVKLRKVRGVADVSPDHKIDIGPPDAPTTW